MSSRRSKPASQPPDDAAVPEEAGPELVLPDTAQIVLRYQKQPSPEDWDALQQKIAAWLEEFLKTQKPPRWYGLGDLYMGVAEQVERTIGAADFKSREGFWAWIRTMAKHSVIDAVRKEGRGVRVVERQEGETSPLDAATGNEPTPSALVRSRELETAVDECLAAMDSERTRVLRLYRAQVEGGGQVDYGRLCGEMGVRNSSKERNRLAQLRFRAAEELLGMLFRRFGRETPMGELLSRLV